MMAGLLRRDAGKEAAQQQLDTLVDLNRRAMLDLMQAVVEELASWAESSATSPVRSPLRGRTRVARSPLG